MSHYHITTVKDFLAIPEDKIDACLADFETWLRLSRQKAAAEKAFDAMIGISGSVRLDVEKFHWVDDGIAGISAVDISCDGIVIHSIPIGGAA